MSQVLEPDAIDSVDEERETPTVTSRAADKPYVTPVVASFALDPHDADSGDALTANA